MGIVENSIHGDPRFVADDRILRGDKFLAIRGCAAYLTQQKIRHSSFCYILYTEIPSQTPGTKIGATSATANSNVAIQNCAAGFDTT
jgi:hypothetical protein